MRFYTASQHAALVKLNQSPLFVFCITYIYIGTDVQYNNVGKNCINTIHKR